MPLVTGGEVRAVNLDYAASTPPLEAVAKGVAEILPWYSSVHRGAGFRSQVSTALYESAREAVRSFLGVPDDQVVLFTRNTTDSINLLAASIPPGTRVITFAVEHHANLLPWRRRQAVHLPVPGSPDELLSALDRALGELPADVPRLVATTGASNVTGEIWPLAAIAELVHRHGGRLFVDAAQLAPHAPIDVATLGIDYLAASGHKLYAPFGAGVLVGRGDWLSGEAPFLLGGGAVEFVTLDDVLWRPLPDRQEAGSPNVVGAVALAIACRTLQAYGMAAIEAEELELAAYGRELLRRIPGLDLYATWTDDHPRIGLLTFNLAGYHHSELAAILSAEYGIAVRHGCFCAHPLLLHLLRIGEERAAAIRAELRAGGHPDLPGAVRLSLGLATTRADLEAAAAALTTIARVGPRWTYAVSASTGEFEPVPDPRPWPTLPLERPAAHRPSSGESS